MPETYINTVALNTDILLWDGGTVINSVGASVTDPEVGVYISGGSAAVFNSGTISAPSTIVPTNERYGIGVGLVSSVSNYVSNSANGLISAGNAAIALSGAAGTVVNHGIVTGRYLGIVSYSALTLANYGLIEGTSDNIILVNSHGLSGIGVDLQYGGSIDNDGTILGGNVGVFLYGAGNSKPTIINSGLIEATGKTFVTENGTYSSDGIELFQPTYVLNTKNGTISGVGSGIQNFGTGSVTIVNDGLIEATATGTYQNDAGLTYPGGVAMNAGGTLINNQSGTITGVVGVGIDSTTIASYFYNAGIVVGSIAFGALLTGDTRMVNTGTITDTQDGLILETSAPVTNTSSGSISGGEIGIFASGTATIDNAGDISGAWVGIEISPSTAAIVDNSGTIATSENEFEYGDSVIVSGALDILGSGTVDNEAGGAISGGAGVYFAATGTEINDGTITGSLGTAVYFAGSGSTEIVDPDAIFNGAVYDAVGDGTLVFASASSAGLIDSLNTEFQGFDTIDVEAGGNWTFASPFSIASGEVVEDDGSLSIAGTVTNNGTIDIDPAVMVFESAVTGDGTIIVSPDSVAIFYSTVASTETIELAAGGTLEIADATDFHAVIEGDGGGTIETICYLPGTRILTAKGEVNVENLVQGDLVVTRGVGLSPVKWVGRQSFSPSFLTRDRLPVCIAPGALGAGLPVTELRVSPGHSMLIDGQLILAKNLVNGITITQKPIYETVEYYAVDLGPHDCVLANGAWSESFADGPGLRAMFHNFSDYLVLHPDFEAPDELTLYATRPQSGPELEAALLPILKKLNVSLGLLHGYIEVVNSTRVEGWAFDEANPDLPVLVDILDDETILGQALACHHRRDLAEAGLGRGHCMFSFDLPAMVVGQIRVRRSMDGTELVRTHQLLHAA
jgi:hypothetical protein